MHLVSDLPPTSRWKEALVHMKDAQAILDEADISGVVGPQLDLAISRLEAEIGRCATEPPPAQDLFEEVEQAVAAVRREAANDVEVW